MEIKKKVLNKIIHDTESLFKIDHQLSSLSSQISKTLESKQGRVFFLGSGPFLGFLRLELDEMGDYFNVDPKRFNIIISGLNIQETNEEWKTMGDMAQAAVVEMETLNLSKDDTLVIISNSGRGEYIKGAVNYAGELGTNVAIVTNTKDKSLLENIDLVVQTNFGDIESTGLNIYSVATMQKIVIDTIIFDSLEKMGRIWEGHLVYLKPFTLSVRKDCIKILSDIAKISESEADEYLLECENKLEIAIISKKMNVSIDNSKELLIKHNFNFNKIIK